MLGKVTSITALVYEHILWHLPLVWHTWKNSVLLFSESNNMVFQSEVLHYALCFEVCSTHWVDFAIFAHINCILFDFFLCRVSQSDLMDRIALWHNCSCVSLAGVSSNFASEFYKNPPPRTPDKCDGDLSFDAVSELQQELLFFKGRYGGHRRARQLQHPFEISVPITLLLSGSCGASTQILTKRASLWSGACGPTASRRTSTPSIKMCRQMLSCFSKVTSCSFVVFIWKLLQRKVW